MAKYPLTLPDIVSWYCSKRRSLDGSGISLADIRESAGEKPAAVADFDAANSMGRITGWVSGEFDFEALRCSDGRDLLWRHVDVNAIEELESAYSDFIRIMLNPDSAGIEATPAE